MGSIDIFIFFTKGCNFSRPEGQNVKGVFRGGSRTAATSKVELFVIIVNGWQPLTIITESSILDVAAVLDPPLSTNLMYVFLLLPIY